MSTYYIFSTVHPQAQTVARALHNLFKQYGGNFMPVFNTARTRVLVQLKDNMATNLRTTLASVAISSSQNVNSIVDESFNSIQPPEESVKAVLEGRAPLSSIL